MKCDYFGQPTAPRSRCVEAWTNRGHHHGCEPRQRYLDRTHDNVCAQRELDFAQRNDEHDGARTL